MPDLAERIRDFVDTAQPTVTMDEVTHTLHSKQVGGKYRGQTHRRRWISTVGLVAAAIILIVHRSNVEWKLSLFGIQDDQVACRPFAFSGGSTAEYFTRCGLAAGG